MDVFSSEESRLGNGIAYISGFGSVGLRVLITGVGSIEDGGFISLSIMGGNSVSIVLGAEMTGLAMGGVMDGGDGFRMVTFPWVSLGGGGGGTFGVTFDLGL